VKTLKIIQVPPTYKGMHMPERVTKDAMIDLLDKLNAKAVKEDKSKKKRAGVQGLLHTKYALTIVVEYMEIVRRLGPVVHVSTALPGKITVVGDMHGQLRDLVEIFRHNGFPSFDNPYLFNGDLVDRGEYSAELCLLLMGFEVADPGSVYINRGNHEDMTVCTGYGFVDELVMKFGGAHGMLDTNGRHLLAIIDTIFSLLPLAHVIDSNVLVIHGGISDKFTLAQLAMINRRPYRTLTGLPPTITQAQGGADAEGHDHATWAILMDCLWSDPARGGEAFEHGKLCKPNAERGGGVMWGAKFTEQFLEREKLGVLVRSHECQDAGFSTCHADRVLTLFSASNYYGDDEANDGAILVLSPHHERGGELLTFATSDGHGFEKMDLKQTVAKLESAAIERVEVALLDHRREIVAGLKTLDTEGAGLVRTLDWADVMGKAVPIKLPWLHLKHKFVDAAGTDADGHDCVDYRRLTEKLGQAFGPDDAPGSTMRESLYLLRRELLSVFRILDKDCSGILSKSEFQAGCKLINSLAGETIFEADDVESFMAKLDVNGDGGISFQEFSDGLLQPHSHLRSKE